MEVWDLFAIIGIILVIILVLGALLSGNHEKEVEKYKQQIIDEYLAKEKHKQEFEERIRKSNEVIESFKRHNEEWEEKSKELQEQYERGEIKFFDDGSGITSQEISELQKRKIESKYYKPKPDAENVDMFYKQKMVITGTFPSFPDRNVMAKLLWESGADLDYKISDNTKYVIIGENAGWKKLEEIERLGITTFTEEEFKKIYGIK